MEEEKSEYVKVSYNITKETKAVLDDLKIRGIKNISDLIDTLCRFDFEAASKFIEIINLLKNPENKFKRMRVKNGSIFLQESVNERIDFLEPALESDFDALTIQSTSILNEDKFKKDALENNFVTKSELEIHSSVVKRLYFKFTEAEEKLNNMELSLKKHGIKIEDEDK